MSSIHDISRIFKQQFIDSLDQSSQLDAADSDQDKSLIIPAFLDCLLTFRREISPLVISVNTDLMSLLSSSSILSRLNVSLGAILGFTSPPLAKAVVQEYVLSRNAANYLNIYGPQPGTLADKQLKCALRQILDGALSNAKATLDRYLELNPRDFIARQVLGFTSFCVNDIIGSKKEFSLAVKLVKTGSTRDLVFSKLCLASLYGVDNDISYALHVCSEAIALEGPSMPEGFYLYAILCLMNGERRRNMTDYFVAAFWGNPALVFLPTLRIMSAEMRSMYEHALSAFNHETSILAKSMITQYESLSKSLHDFQCERHPDAFSSTIRLIDAEIIPGAERLLVESTIFGNLNALSSLASAKSVVKDALRRTGKRLFSNLNYAAFELDSKDSIRIDLATKATAWTRDSIIFESMWIGGLLLPLIVIFSPGDIVGRIILFFLSPFLGVLLGLGIGAVMAPVFKAEGEAYIKKMSLRTNESERLRREASAVDKAIDEILLQAFPD